jgi:hypothetical protein
LCFLAGPDNLVWDSFLHPDSRTSQSSKTEKGSISIRRTTHSNLHVQLVQNLQALVRIAGKQDHRLKDFPRPRYDDSLLDDNSDGSFHAPPIPADVMAALGCNIPNAVLTAVADNNNDDDDDEEEGDADDDDEFAVVDELPKSAIPAAVGGPGRRKAWLGKVLPWLQR